MLKEHLYNLYLSIKLSSFVRYCGTTYIRLRYLWIVKFSHDKLIKKETLPWIEESYSFDRDILPLEGRTVIAVVPTTIGLSDRLRGAVFVYRCVKELNDLGYDLKFRVLFDTPFQLYEYLEPNLYDWRVDSSEVSYNLSQVEPIRMWHHRASTDAELKLRMDKMKDIIQRSDKKQIHISTNILDYDRVKCAQCFNELFKPALPVESELKKNTNRMNGVGYVNTAFRFLDLLGDFNENRGVVIEDKTKKQRLIESCLAQIDILHKRHPTKSILVTSDSKTFLKCAEDRFSYVHIVDGEITHIARTNESSFDLYLKTFVDWLMISRADNIYLLRTGRMYKSGFPETAALIENKPFEYIEF